MDINDINILLQIGERITFECKKAEEHIPKSVWETYSSFANTIGGTILLGIKEHINESESDKRFEITGVVNAHKMKKEFFAGFPDLGQYLTYNAPYWRLRVGDFATREDAQRVLEQLKQEYPRLAGEMRLVRDRIKYVE